MLSREQFCKITGLQSVDALKSRARRGQLPVSTDDVERKSYGYSVFDAFVTIIADRLSVGGIGLNAGAAARVAREMAPALAAKWPQIVKTAQAWQAGEQPDEIEWQLVWRPMGDGHLMLVGTVPEVAEGRADGKSATDVIGGNATRSAFGLLHRASYFEIELSGEELTQVPTFRPGDINGKFVAAHTDRA